MLLKLTSQRPTAPEDLVDLLSECHARIRHFITVAQELARRDDVPAHQVTQACADVTRYFDEALPLHVADEEQSIAPRIRGLSSEVGDALAAMSAQHEEHAVKLELLLRALSELGREPLSERARAELAAVAEPLREELEAHLALEERVLFPAIRRLVPPATQKLIIDELRQRRQTPGEKP